MPPVFSGGHDKTVELVESGRVKVGMVNCAVYDRRVAQGQTDPDEAVMTTIGYWVRDARAKGRYDIMWFLMALTVLLVVFGELCSYATRRWVR